MEVSISARDKEGILNGADIHLARMVGVPGTKMFVDGSFIVNLIFCNQVVGVKFQCCIFIRTIYLVNARLHLIMLSDFHSRQVTTAPYRTC